MSKFSCFGVVHLLPLPGTPYSKDSLAVIVQRALHDAGVLQAAGFDGVVLENFGDAPFVSTSVEPHIVASMTYIASQIRNLFPNLRMGINILRNDAHSAMAVASIVGAEFIRVNVHTGSAWTDQGLIEGKAYETLMYRRQLGSSVHIAADILVKHASPAGRDDLCDLAIDTYLRGGAQTLILTGARTGAQTEIQDIQRLHSILPNVPIWVGSGVTPQNFSSYTECASGAIIGSYLHEQGKLDQPLSLNRAREFSL